MCVCCVFAHLAQESELDANDDHEDVEKGSDITDRESRNSEELKEEVRGEEDCCESAREQNSHCVS